MAGASLVLAYYLRLGDAAFDGRMLEARIKIFIYGVPAFMAVAGAHFLVFGLYRGIWRYTSLSDLVAILKATTLAILVFLPLLFLTDRMEALPRSVPLIQWLVLVMLLAAPRAAFRLFRHNRAARRLRDRAGERIPVLLVGTDSLAELFIRAMTSDPQASYQVVGLLSTRADKVGRVIHGLTIYGGLEDLDAVTARLHRRGLRPHRLILADDGGRIDTPTLRRLFDQASRLGMSLARLPNLTEFKSAHPDNADGRLDPRPIALEDLLGRPQTVLDDAAIRHLIAGRRVLITGAGGSIGGELARQIAAYGPAALLLLDHGEYNLYAIDRDLREQCPQQPFSIRLADVRDRTAIFALFEALRPEVVFHAAALKHVPMVELNPLEGALTNGVGTRNVADAALAIGAQAMVQISTDKAVNPTSVMGATKRLAEYYCQAQDLAEQTRASAEGRSPCRFIAVRFGNVLGSSGSVVPLFQKQLARGGPLTVTHPEIRRYFMTTAEAVALLLQAAAHGLEQTQERGRIFVLDMGQPIRIVDIARQMIRLAGRTPDTDVAITYTGLRPGEKFYEELFDASETPIGTAVKGVMAAMPRPIDLARLQTTIDEIAALGRQRLRQHEDSRVRALLAQIVPGYQPADEDTPPSASSALSTADDPSQSGRDTVVPLRKPLR